jgi:hypothetical protein
MSASRMTTQSTSSASLLYLSQWTIPAGLFIAGYLQKHKKKKKKKKKKNINLCFLLFSMRRLQKGFRFFLNKKNLKESTMVEQKEKNS